MFTRGRFVRDAASQQASWVSYTDPTLPLTASWQYSDAVSVSGLTQLTAYIMIVKGAADAVEFKFQYSFEGTVFYDRDAGGFPPESKSTTDVTYTKRVSIPLLDNYVRIAFKGKVTGPATFATTVVVADAVFGDAAFTNDMDGVVNSSDAMTYDAGGHILTITRTMGGNNYLKTLTWVGDNLTAVSAWSEI
jgi:hypothetical protein